MGLKLTVSIFSVRDLDYRPQPLVLCCFLVDLATPNHVSSELMPDPRKEGFSKRIQVTDSSAAGLALFPGHANSF